MKIVGYSWIFLEWLGILASSSIISSSGKELFIYCLRSRKIYLYEEMEAQIV